MCFRSAHSNPVVSRPKLLIHGEPSLGHTSHLAPALIHAMERIPTHLLDLPTLYANSSRTAEESCTQVLTHPPPVLIVVCDTPLLTGHVTPQSGVPRGLSLHPIHNLHPSSGELVAGAVRRYESYVSAHGREFRPSDANSSSCHIQLSSVFTPSRSKSRSLSLHLLHASISITIVFRSCQLLHELEIIGHDFFNCPK